MSLRLPTFCLLSLLLGCASADVASDALIEADDRGAPRELELASASPPVEVLPGQTVELAVRYRSISGESPAGLQVEFALAGMASGASLTPARAVTDGAGVARTKLRAGTMPGMLQVRAGSERTNPVYVDVLVVDALPSEARVRVAYEGARALASYTITALPSSTCQQALARNLSGDVVHRIEDAEEAIQFELPPGSSTAVLAWGSDDTGAPLARGCRDVEAPFTVNPAQRLLSVSVPLIDVDLRLEGTLPVEIALNVAATAKRVAETASRTVQRVVSPSGGYSMFAEADYYLDAIARTLQMNQDSEALAALEAARSSSTLAASLAPAMTRAGVGPLNLAAKLATLVTVRGSVLLVSGSLTGLQLGSVDDLSAQSADRTDSLRLPLQVPTFLDASFDEARAELLVKELRIELGVGAYGRALLAQLLADPSLKLMSSLETSAGCAEVVAPWAEAQLKGVCDRACALATCKRSTAELLSAVQAALAEPEEASSGITLSGPVTAHDRTDDGVVDDLGPSELDGRWSPTDVVNGELREPTRNALTL